MTHFSHRHTFTHTRRARQLFVYQLVTRSVLSLYDSLNEDNEMARTERIEVYQRVLRFSSVSEGGIFLLISSTRLLAGGPAPASFAQDEGGKMAVPGTARLCLQQFALRVHSFQIDSSRF